MRPERLLGVLLLGLALHAHAQLRDDPDWKEDALAPPPKVRKEGLIPLDMDRSALRWGVDPDSVRIGEDGIVRYVVVAQSDGAFTAIYEGIRCSTFEVKVYARANGPEWGAPVQDAWKPLKNSRHSFAIADAAACVGRSANLSARRIVQDLRASPFDRKRL